MAKLQSYYGLCPLIDQKNLLGVSEDVEPGHAIVTLGRNIAIKYRLSDQKQIQSWRTKDKFSSPVVFNREENKYVAAFNQVILRLWGADDDIELLDKVRKYKIKKPIYTVVNCNGRTYVVFLNGTVLSLKETLEQRKDLDIKDVINTNDEEIEDVIHINVEEVVYIGLITKSQSGTNCILTSFPQKSLHSNFSKIELIRNDVSLSGYTFCQMHNKYLHLLTLWTDGRLYSYQITGVTNQEETSTDATANIGTLYATIESVSCKHFVPMIALTSDHVAMYGADCNQEGANLVIYNTQFKIKQSEQKFKMFSNITKIWCIGNSLLLCSGQNLAVVPFSINSEQLSLLIGSHKFDLSEGDVQETFIVEKWDIENDFDYSESIPVKIKSDVLELLGQGLSEVTVCDHLISTYIENSDIIAVESCLGYFKDISEICLVKLLAYLTENQLKYDKSHTLINNHLINKILALPSADVLLLPHFKASVSISTALLLLKYICFLLTSDVCLPEFSCIQTEEKLIMWGCVILDANYQKFLLSPDSEVFEVLKNFNELVREHLQCLNYLRSLEPVIDEYVKGKSSSDKHKSNVKYSIEEVKLY